MGSEEIEDNKLERSVTLMRTVIEKATGYDLTPGAIEKLVRDHWVELQKAAHSIHDAITFERGRERGKIDQQDAREEIERKARIKRCAPEKGS